MGQLVAHLERDRGPACGSARGEIFDLQPQQVGSLGEMPRCDVEHLCDCIRGIGRRPAVELEAHRVRPLLPQNVPLWFPGAKQ